MKALRSLLCAQFEVPWLSFMYIRQYGTESIVVVSSSGNYHNSKAAMKSEMVIDALSELCGGGEVDICLFQRARDGFLEIQHAVFLHFSFEM